MSIALSKFYEYDALESELRC